MAKTLPPELFTAVRVVVHEIANKPLDEITLESHLYWDIELSSLGVVELIMALEERLGLAFGDMDDIEFSFSQEGVGSWEEYVRAVKAYAEKSLSALHFSPYVEERVLEIEALSREYGVLPFSVGFVCAFVSRRLDELKESSGG